MKKIRYASIILCIFIITSCDPLSDEYLSRLLGLEEVDITRLCENNPQGVSDGTFIEIYSLSENTLNAFTKKFIRGIDTIDVPINKDNYFIKKGHILTWRRTPINQTDYLTDILNLIIESDMKCYTKNDIFNLLRNKNNYYTIFYDKAGTLHIDKFKLFIIDSENSHLYLLTSH
jgi:hypothetical protein